MRTMFPQDAARRTFLKLGGGAATAPAAVSQFFPQKAVTEAFAAGGRNHIIDFLVTRSKTFSDPARDPRSVPLGQPGINEPVIVSSSTGETKRSATIQSNVK